MRRSSWVMLLVACLIAAGLVFLYLHPFDTTAPPMTPRLATRILERGKAALERRDTEGIMALLAPDAVILDRRPDQIRLLLNRAMRELGSEHLTATIANVTAAQHGSAASVSADVSVGQNTGGADATYYSTHLNIGMQKRQIKHWFGLYTTEEWLVTSVDSDSPFGLPF